MRVLHQKRPLFLLVILNLGWTSRRPPPRLGVTSSETAGKEYPPTMTPRDAPSRGLDPGPAVRCTVVARVIEVRSR